MKATSDSATTEEESTDIEHTDERPADCNCWRADEDTLPCWPCYRDGYTAPNPATPGADESDEEREEDR